MSGQFRLLLRVAPCWIEAPWHPTASNMLEDIPCQYPTITDLSKDILVGSLIKGLLSHH